MRWDRVFGVLGIILAVFIMGKLAPARDDKPPVFQCEVTENDVRQIRARMTNGSTQDTNRAIDVYCEIQRSIFNRDHTPSSPLPTELQNRVTK